MKKKTFMGIMLVCIVVPVLVFGVYQFSSSDSYSQGVKQGNFTGFTEGYLAGRNAVSDFKYSSGFRDGNETGFRIGYQAGLNAQIESTPTPAP